MCRGRYTNSGSPDSMRGTTTWKTACNNQLCFLMVHSAELSDCRAVVCAKKITPPPPKKKKRSAAHRYDFTSGPFVRNCRSSTLNLALLFKQGCGTCRHSLKGKDSPDYLRKRTLFGGFGGEVGESPPNQSPAPRHPQKTVPLFWSGACQETEQLNRRQWQLETWRSSSCRADPWILVS